MRNRYWVVAVSSSCLVTAAVMALGGFVWTADEPRIGTLKFGDIPIELGMEKDEVIAALQRRFKLQGDEPDRDRPDLSFYSVFERRPFDQAIHVGGLSFSGGKLHLASRSVMDGKKTLDSQELMIRLTDLLSVTSEKLDTTTPKIRWDDGVFHGRKIGNRELSFDFGAEHVTVHYYDSPGGSQNVTLTLWIGEI